MNGDFTGTIIWLVFFVGIMYLLIFLPQKKRDKRTKLMLESLSVGNEVITIGGICGKIINMKEDEVTIETSTEKTKLNIKKWGIKDVKELISA